MLSHDHAGEGHLFGFDEEWFPKYLFALRAPFAAYHDHVFSIFGHLGVAEGAGGRPRGESMTFSVEAVCTSEVSDSDL